MTREEKKNFLLNQLPPNTDCYYVDGFINGFDCTYDAVLKDFEAEMKAKDEEIVKLKLEVLSSFPKIANTKARKIIAMLFWEWRKAETRYQEEWKTKRDNRQLSLLSISSYKAEVLFKQAYKMLKDNA